MIHIFLHQLTKLKRSHQGVVWTWLAGRVQEMNNNKKRSVSLWIFHFWDSMMISPFHFSFFPFSFRCLNFQSSIPLLPPPKPQPV